MRRIPFVALLALTLLPAWLTPTPVSAALSGAERCRIAKLNAIAAEVRRLLQCEAQAIRRGQEPAGCLVPAPPSRLQRAFERAEKLGTCPPTLAEAQLATLSFALQIRGGVSATPTPAPTATPILTPSASPSPTPTTPATCGNGVVDPGENCDGGPYCDAACDFAFPALCCEVATLCVAPADIAEAEQCFLAGGTLRLGTTCTREGAPCPPGQLCGGACEATTFPPTAFCCDGGGACTQSTHSSTESLASLLLQCGPEAVVVGTCVNGSCVPGG
ncbi:MAG TPA: hypothetical protein VIS07_06770 [Candidatus Binatia bacterium]